MNIDFSVMHGTINNIVMYLVIILGISLITMTIVGMILKALRVPEVIIRSVIVVGFLYAIYLLFKGLNL